MFVLGLAAQKYLNENMELTTERSLELVSSLGLKSTLVGHQWCFRP